ncbi:MAG: tetratricopeptide repeat protein [Bacteroides sp.]|nr:tetratricopeptide repeat protein [Ruminococcus flavefaciens]MCM1554869.1 tetratricopeptide repeat protein [Bacteroides sp.]
MIGKAVIRSFLALFLTTGLAWNARAQKKTAENFIKSADYYKFINEDSCLYFANEVYRIGLTKKDLYNQALALTYIAHVNRNKGNYETSLDLCRNIRELAQRIDDRQLFAKSLHLTGVTYMEMGIFDAAYTNLTDALRIYENLSDKTPTAAFYNALAVLYAKQSNIEKAQEYLQKGLKVADTVDMRERILLNGNMALCLLYDNKSEEGEQLLHNQIRLIEEQNIPYSTAVIYQNLCRINIELGNYRQALHYGREALTSALERNNQISIAQALYYTGYIYLTSETYDTALSIFKEVDTIASNLDLLEIRLYVAEHLSLIYERQGDFRQAYNYARLQNELTDSFNRKNTRNDLYRLNLEFQYGQQMEQLQAASRKRNISWSIGALCLVVVSALLWLFLSRQRFKLNNARLQQQNILLTLDQRNREITSKAIQIQQKNKAISDSIAELSQSRHGLKKNDQSVINNVIRKLSTSINDNAWNEFELRFEQVHTGFFKSLNEKFPNLSPNEKKLCAYLKLGMTSKEIANLTHTTVGSVEQARFRLRKKLGLHTTNTDLAAFIETL